MPKCATCGQFFGPNFCIVANENSKEFQCVFCYLGKNEITVETKDGQEKKVTKKDANKEYMKYLKKLHNNKNVQEIVNPKSNIIKP